VRAIRAAIDTADSDPPTERKRLAYRLDRHRGPPLTQGEQTENIRVGKSSLEAAVIEYPNVPGPELRRIMAGLGRDYFFYLCTMTYPDYCEDVVARMIEFGKPLGQENFNYLRETYPDHSVHYFWFNRWADVMAFQKKFEGNMGQDFDNVVAEHSYRTMPTA
jgi:hypothetical protein